MFQFVLRYLGWLKHLPLLPQLFDAMLLLQTLLTRPVVLDLMQDFEAKILSIQGVGVRPHKFGGVGYCWAGTELAHIHGNGLLDIRLNNIARRMAVAHNMASQHHVLPDSGWVSIWLTNAAAVDNAYKLALLSHQLFSTKQASA